MALGEVGGFWGGELVDVWNDSDLGGRPWYYDFQITHIYVYRADILFM